MPNTFSTIHIRVVHIAIHIVAVSANIGIPQPSSSPSLWPAPFPSTLESPQQAVGGSRCHLLPRLLGDSPLTSSPYRFQPKIRSSAPRDGRVRGHRACGLIVIRKRDHSILYDRSTGPNRPLCHRIACPHDARGTHAPTDRPIVRDIM